MQNDSRGFTLIEVMITIAVLTILVTLAVPHYNSTLNSVQLNSTYKELITVLAAARNQALTLKQDVIVQFNREDQNTGTSLNWKVKHNNTLAKLSSIPTLIFTPFGTVKNYNLSHSILTICNSYLKKSKRVQVTRTGSIVSLADGSCT